jgi:putative ABC transport system ATP-binding protein
MTTGATIPPNTATRDDVVAEVRGVCKVYQTSREAPKVEALRGVDLIIGRGESLAIMGPSGGGKSTLMNILGCLDRPTSGDYLVAGRNVRDLSDPELSRIRGKHVGFIFQAFNLIPQLTVIENVQVPLFYQSVPPRERARLSQEAIERVGLGNRGLHRPAELSGGQMQRVAVARALVNRPTLLLADEPTGNLDSATGASILALFDELHGEGLTIVMVTHDPAVGRRCQRIIWLRDGLIDTQESITH